MPDLETATLAGGCFWCTEAVFKRLKGVERVIPGYAGGHVDNPSYEEVCTGATGHAEAIQVTFDPAAIPYEKLLEVFWHLHDPTTLNRQGADVGTQYSSAIFYHTEQQREAALRSREETEKSRLYRNRIVTEIVPFTKFYEAEGYHLDFYDNNRSYPYCEIVIDPKVAKLYREFPKDLNSL